MDMILVWMQKILELRGPDLTAPLVNHVYTGI